MTVGRSLAIVLWLLLVISGLIWPLSDWTWLGFVVGAICSSLWSES